MGPSVPEIEMTSHCLAVLAAYPIFLPRREVRDARQHMSRPAPGRPADSVRRDVSGNDAVFRVLDDVSTK